MYPETFARFYDLIYHQMRDHVDLDFFLDEIDRTRGRILEVGSGTGRLFTNALLHGADIFGIDISESMLKVLKSKIKPDDYYRVSNQNILDFRFDFKFDLIIAPFRVIMHVDKKEEQLRALNNVYNHPEYRSVVQKLKERLKLLKEEAGDPDEKYPKVKEISGL